MSRSIVIGLCITVCAFKVVAKENEIALKSPWEFRFLWGASELWWYNLAEIFSYDCEVKFRTEDASSLWIEAKGRGFFGVNFPCGRVLEKGKSYDFSIAAVPKPDYIVFDKKIVWDGQKDIYEKSYAKFSYTPGKNEVPQFYIINNATPEGLRVNYSTEKYFQYRIIAREKKVPKGSEKMSFAEFDFPDKMNTWKIDPSVACSVHDDVHDKAIKNYQLPEVPKVNYATSRVKVIESSLSPERLKNDFDYYIPFTKPANIILMGWNWSVSATEKYAAVYKNSDKELAFFHIHISPKWTSRKIRQNMEKLKRVVKRAAELLPSRTVYIIAPEHNSLFGTWRGGIEYSPLANYSEEMRSEIRKGGNAAYDSILGFLQEFDKELHAVAPGRVKIIAYADRSAFPAAYLAKTGADGIMGKNIHRQSVNISVANVRGTAKAYDMPYGFDFDSWDRNYQKGYTTDEIRHVLNYYLQANPWYLMNESNLIFSRNRKGITQIGKTWFDFLKYARTHPAIGDTVVPFAVMRGLPDEWTRAASPSASWESAKNGNEESFKDYFEDYNLLNIFFNGFGNFHRTFTDRPLTGTPLGALDMIPWDTPLNKLEAYKLVVYLGKSECMNDNQYETLKNYVKNGGTLLMAAGQLRKKDGEFYKKNIEDFFGVEIVKRSTLNPDGIWDREKMNWSFEGEYKKYIRLRIKSEDAQVLARLKNSAPHVVFRNFGKGRVYLFASDYLAEHRIDTAARIIVSEAQKHKILSLAPESVSLEHVINKKGEVYTLALFNHGNVGFPSGNRNRSGKWKGELALDLRKLGINGRNIEVCLVKYDASHRNPFSLKRIKSENKEGVLRFKLEIDKFSEVVLGSRGKVRKNYFGNLPNTLLPCARKIFNND